MQSRWLGAAATSIVVGLALTGCSGDDDPASAPTLPAIVTTTPLTTPVNVATTRPEYYEVKRGDTLTVIAAAYSIPVQALLNANPELSSPDDIQAGQFLYIPPREGLVAEELPPTVPGQTAPTMPGAATVTPTSVP